MRAETTLVATGKIFTTIKPTYLRRNATSIAHTGCLSCGDCRKSLRMKLKDIKMYTDRLLYLLIVIALLIVTACAPQAEPTPTAEPTVVPMATSTIAPTATTAPTVIPSVTPTAVPTEVGSFPIGKFVSQN